MTSPGHPPLKFIDHPSPNHGERKAVDGKTGVRLVVLHYTGMATAAQALARLTDKDTQVSAHYLIDEDGKIHRLVAEDRRAWHAGVSYWRGVRDINSASIGIELANPGHDYGYRPFPQAQIDALGELVRSIMTRHGLAPHSVIGHSDIAPGRKIDPGELFPWQPLAGDGIGVWPTLKGTKHLITIDHALRLLSAIGYATPLSADLGADILSGSTEPIAAFQRHYRPRKIDGILDSETSALIQTLAPSDLA
ncbi:MAG: N-acetylmuramoyl-L-alanine amidase [Rhodospirillaceae bacterium]|nr:N-acetylmuramoyl-L-alanine amidase [Rhodospirillaceae bacterium]